MSRALLAAFLAAAAAPALAQHEHHSAPSADPHAGHAMPDAPAGDDPHAGHTMTAPPAEEDPHHAGHAMPQAPANPHAGHAMPAPADPHAGHGSASTGEPPVAPPPPAALEGPAYAADRYFDPGLMAAARHHAHAHGGLVTWALLIDRLELRQGDGETGQGWDAEGWVGGDEDKLWLKSEGEGGLGKALEAAEVQALWSHALTPFWNLEAGVRHDVRPDPSRTYAVLGVQGLAPYWIEVDASLFLSGKGELSARVEAEHDARLTNRLILQPQVEVDLAAQDTPELGIGRGLAKLEGGLRLRYQVTPTIAPYVGALYERRFGRSADFARAAGDDPGGLRVVTGLRVRF